MSHKWMAVLLSTLAALPAWAALQAGASAPDFQAPASLSGKTFAFSLKEALLKGPVVVYFYPSAYTEGCNIQAHEFAVNQDKFTEAGAAVIGVSLDSIERLNQFSADPKYCGGKVAVASDVEGRIAKLYELKIHAGHAGLKDTRGVDIDHGFAERTTFVVTPDGKVNAVVGGVSPEANVEKALGIVQRLAAERH